MLVELRLSSRLTLSGVIVAVLLYASSAFAGPSEDCAAGAAYGQQDYAVAFRLCRSLAEQGDAKAQSALGFMYANGEGVQKDYAASAKWYRKAAEQGYARAQSAVGYMYELGRRAEGLRRGGAMVPQGRRTGQCRAQSSSRLHVRVGPGRAARLRPRAHVV